MLRVWLTMEAKGLAWADIVAAGGAGACLRWGRGVAGVGQRVTFWIWGVAGAEEEAMGAGA